MLKIAPEIPPQAPKNSPYASAAEYAAYWEEKKRREEDEAKASAIRLRGIPIRRHDGVAPKPWRGGLLHGPAGVGKTREAIARLLSTPRGIFYEAAEFIEDARAMELDRADADQERRWREASRTEHLVFDDLGARRPTPFAEDAVLRLINDRWKSERETLVTSNLAPAEIMEIWGQRIASRIEGFGPVEILCGKDRRKG